MRPGVFASEISEDLPQPRRLLAQALRDLYESLPCQNGKRMSHARLLAVVEAGHSTSSLCRYFNGQYVPSEDFVKKYHKAISGCTSEILPLTCEELQELRRLAAATDGRRREARDGNNTQGSAPVPSSEGDRQGNAFTGRPAPLAATEAIQLSELGLHEQALTLLSQVSEHHDADEAAHCVVHFRAEGHDELADTLIQIYGRDHRGNRMHDVVRMSMTLRELHLPDDADSLLKLVI